MRSKLLIAFCFTFLSLIVSADSKKIIGLDVRSKMEVVFKKAPGAVHIPVSDVSKETTKDIPKDTPIKVFCEGGARAAQAKEKLEALGFTQVENIGSWRDWNKDYAEKEPSKD